MNGQDYDRKYLIVGQGLAGTLLVYALLKRGVSIHVIGNTNATDASSIAAGLINPITGRRYVKSWKVDKLIPCAKKVYAELGMLLNKEYFHAHEIHLALESAGEQNDFLARKADSGYQQYLSDKNVMDNYTSIVHPPHYFGAIKDAAQVDIGHLRLDFQQYLVRQDMYTEEQFDYAQLKHIGEKWSYKDRVYKNIIFSEGVGIHKNPFFNYLPLIGDKGELLRIRIEGNPIKEIMKYKLFVIPMAEGDYWAGGTYDKGNLDATPTEAAKEDLSNRLTSILKKSYQIDAHRSAIRPTVMDRRPLLGVHPLHSHMYVFNGLGAKGTSLGPYWSGKMVEYLEDGANLDQEVDIARFRKG